jgi:hypothetical protein
MRSGEATWTVEAVFTTTARGKRSDRSWRTPHGSHDGIPAAAAVSANNDIVASVRSSWSCATSAKGITATFVRCDSAVRRDRCGVDEGPVCSAIGKVAGVAALRNAVWFVRRAKGFRRCYAQADCHAERLSHPRSRKQAAEHWGDHMTISRAELPTEELPYVEQEPARPDRRRFVIVGGAGVVVVIAAIVASVMMAAGGLNPTANEQPLPGNNDAAATKADVPNAQARAINPQPPAAAAPPAPAPTTPAPVAGLPGGLPGSAGGAPAGGGLPSFGSISRPAASSGGSGAGAWPFALPSAPALPPPPGLPNVNWPVNVPVSVPLEIPVVWPISLPGIDFPDLVINDLLWLAVMGFSQLPAPQWPSAAPPPAPSLQALQSLQFPQVGMPQFPQFQMPPMPQVGLPQLPPPPPVGLPQVGLPQIGLPQIGAPQIGLPKIG